MVKHSVIGLLNLTLLFLFNTGCLKGQYVASSADAPGATVFSGARIAENLSATSVQISWEVPSSTSIKEFNIYQVNPDSSFTLVGIVDASINVFVHSGLTPGKIYSYVVRSVGQAGGDSNNLIVSAITYAGITSSTVVDATTADLSFPSATEASGLRVYCSVGATSTMNLITSLNPLVTSHRLTGLTTSSLHTCKIKAVFGTNLEDSNPLLSSFTPQTVAPNSNFGFAGIGSAINTNGTSAIIQWTAANPINGVTISGYRIYQLNPDDSLTIHNAPSNATSFTVTGLSPGLNYNFIVRALDNGSNTDGNQVMKSAFTYAGITSGGATSATTATIYFPSAVNAASLHVYCYLTSGTPGTTPTASISSVSSSYNVTGLTTATSYTCLVKAVGAAGEDGNNSVVIFVTP